MVNDVYKEDTQQHVTAASADRTDSYIHFTPAVRLGDSLAGLERFQNKSWDEIEPEARQLWEETHQRPWEEYRDVVRQAWARVKAQFNEETEPNEENDSYEALFQRHYQLNYASSQLDYDQFGPAYHYGYDLAVDRRLQDKSWLDIEPQAREYWNSQSFAGPWEEFKEAAHYAWQETRNRMSQ